MLIFLALVLAQPPAAMPKPAVAPPATWVPFVAELKITDPKQQVRYGRHLQDEHGCSRRDTFNPDGTPKVEISNFENGKSYAFGVDGWISRPMRLPPTVTVHTPPRLHVSEKMGEIEGFETWLAPARVTGSPSGLTPRERIVIPALNFFPAVTVLPSGETRTPRRIRLVAPDPAEFLPPPSASIAEVAGYGGYQRFNAVVLRVVFPDRPATELTTTEEIPLELRTPSGEALQVVTTVADDPNNQVRVRILRNAKRAGLGKYSGDVLDEVTVTLGQVGRTTALVENFTVTVTRIGARWAR